MPFAGELRFVFSPFWQFSFRLLFCKGEGEGEWVCQSFCRVLLDYLLAIPFREVTVLLALSTYVLYESVLQPDSKHYSICIRSPKHKRARDRKGITIEWKSILIFLPFASFISSTLPVTKVTDLDIQMQREFHIRPSIATSWALPGNGSLNPATAIAML
jgi:hypothetical protein